MVQKHVRVVSRAPQMGTVPMTSLNYKLNAAVEMMDTILLTQRQLQWKVFFPPTGTDTTDDTTTTTTDTTTTI